MASFQFVLFGNLKCYEKTILKILHSKPKNDNGTFLICPPNVTVFWGVACIIVSILHSLHNNVIMAMVMVIEFYKVYILYFQKHVITKRNIPEELHPAKI